MRLFDVAATVHILSYIVSAAFSYHITQYFKGENFLGLIRSKHFTEKKI